MHLRALLLGEEGGKGMERDSWLPWPASHLGLGASVGCEGEGLGDGFKVLLVVESQALPQDPLQPLFPHPLSLGEY